MDYGQQPCIHCMGLVGAAALIEPHAKLHRMVDLSGTFMLDTRGEEVLGCAACGVRWSLGPYGWSRLPAGR